MSAFSAAVLTPLGNKCLADPLLVCFTFLQAVAKSFGFSGPPRVNLNIESKAAHGRRAAKAKAGTADYRRFKGQSGHTFSAANPYGVRAKGDNRQLARF
jgi:ATP-dependent RNA helicase DDX18/HAS1